MQLRAQFTGNVTNEPTVKKIGAKETPLKELRVAVNHDKKNEAGVFEKTGETSWVKIKLWSDRANEDWRKGDLISYDGTLIEKHWGEDGKGRQLESDYIAELELKYRKDDSPTPAGGDGFVPEEFASGF